MLSFAWNRETLPLILNFVMFDFLPQYPKPDPAAVAAAAPASASAAAATSAPTEVRLFALLLLFILLHSLIICGALQSAASSPQPSPQAASAAGDKPKLKRTNLVCQLCQNVPPAPMHAACNTGYTLCRECWVQHKGTASASASASSSNSSHQHGRGWKCGGCNQDFVAVAAAAGVGGVNAGRSEWVSHFQPVRSSLHVKLTFSALRVDLNSQV